MQAVRTHYLSQYYDTFKLFQHPGGCPTWFPSWELMRNATYQYHGASNQVRNDKNQTDLLILDFSKAFDKVAHKRLLLKLQYYGIRGLVLAWIKAWLIGRTQQVAFEGEISEKSCVRSGVPQGTWLGPLCFLLFVHDIGNDITSNIKLFADDTLLYGLVHNSHDAISLKSDLEKLVECPKLWQMAFEPSKCYVLHVCRTKCPFIHPYPTGCRPLLPLPRSFSVREPKLEVTYPKHYKQS